MVTKKAAHIPHKLPDFFGLDFPACGGEKSDAPINDRRGASFFVDVQIPVDVIGAQYRFVAAKMANCDTCTSAFVFLTAPRQVNMGDACFVGVYEGVLREFILCFDVVATRLSF